MTSYLQFAIYYNPITHKKQEGKRKNTPFSSEKGVKVTCHFLC